MTLATFPDGKPRPRLPAFATLKQASAYCGLSVRTLYRLIGTGALPSHKVGCRRLVAYRDLRQFIEGSPGPSDDRTAE